MNDEKRKLLEAAQAEIQLLRPKQRKLGLVDSSGVADFTALEKARARKSASVLQKKDNKI